MFEKTVQRWRRCAWAVSWAALLSLSNTGIALANPNAESPAVEEVSLPAEVIVRALTLMGITYRWGGNLPETGMDCSGFVRHVFHEAAGLLLPRKSEEMSRAATSIGKEHLLPGDLVFFNTQRRGFSHVGIYLGDDKFVHAPAKGKSIRIDSMGDRYWVRRFDGARRVMGELPHQDPAALDQLIDRTLARIGVPLNELERNGSGQLAGASSHSASGSLLAGGQWRLHANAAQAYMDAQGPGTQQASRGSESAIAMTPESSAQTSGSNLIKSKTQTQMAAVKARQLQLTKLKAAALKASAPKPKMKDKAKQAPSGKVRQSKATARRIAPRT